MECTSRVGEVARRQSGLVTETRTGKLFILCKDKWLLDSVTETAASLKWDVVGHNDSGRMGNADLILAILDPRPGDVVSDLWNRITSDISRIDALVRGHSGFAERAKHSELDEASKRLDVSALEPLVDIGALPRYSRVLFCSTTEKCGMRYCSERGKESRGSFQKYNFLLQSFPCSHVGLPSLPYQLNKLLNDLVVHDPKSESEPSYHAIYRLYAWRMYVILYHAKEMELSWATDVNRAMIELAGRSGGRESRLDHEHGIATKATCAEGRKSLLEEHAKLDYYYLATNAQSRPNQTLVCIDDQPGQFDHFLMLMSRVTGNSIFHSASEDDARACIRSMRGATPSLSGTFLRVGEKGREYNELVDGKPDWLLMDLLIRDRTGRRRIEGTEALARYVERSSETPAILLTWSEETDVAAEALRKSNAVCVVPKRRTLRVPHEMRRYIEEEIGPILDDLSGPGETSNELRVRMLRAFRLWTAYPGILWHGEKTFHAADHTLEHSLGLWKMSNQLLGRNWDWVRMKRLDQYTPDLLFRFLMSIWLHDIGHKGNETYQMADEVRNRHAWLSGELVRRNPELYGLRRGDESEFISLLCAYHQSNAPFRRGTEPKDTVRGLLQRSLEDIEKDSGWQLMGWTALLRLLDAIEHSWRRVGDAKLREAKIVSIEMDSQYYAERSKDSAEAKGYAKWLREQDFHMEKHRSVLDVQITSVRDPERNVVVFWPVFSFISGEAACKFLPEIGRYVLKEWFDARSTTGELLQDRMALRLLHSEDVPDDRKRAVLPNEDDSSQYAVWIPSDEVLKRLNTSDDLIEKSRDDELAPLKRERDQIVRDIWMPKHKCDLCSPVSEEAKQ